MTGDADIDRLRGYLDASPSPFHAARNGADLLESAGFSEVSEASDWSEVPRTGFVVRDGALIGWRTPDDIAPHDPFRIAGAHTDSPCLRVKPNPTSRHGNWHQLGVEVYGGILNNTWLDRDLGVAGRLTLPDLDHVLVDVRHPVARVPQLAVHLDRGVNDGLTLDPQTHLHPVWGTGEGVGDFADYIADQADVDRVVSWELCLYDAQPAAVIGADRSLLASGRLDNQLSCWAALEALSACAPTGATAMIVLNDHEEVGSSSTTGAAGALLERVMERLVVARGGGRDDLLRAMAVSSCVSADNAHALHPNYPERHDASHAPIVNGGPAIKINSNQRYATSSTTAAAFRAACARAGVPSQMFVSRNNMPCGSTIGPITATRLGIDTVDVGVPQLSMHSARELCGTADPVALRAALAEHLSG